MFRCIGWYEYFRQFTSSLVVKHKLENLTGCGMLSIGIVISYNVTTYSKSFFVRLFEHLIESIVYEYSTDTIINTFKKNYFKEVPFCFILKLSLITNILAFSTPSNITALYRLKYFKQFC